MLTEKKNCVVFRIENLHVQNQLENNAEPTNIDFLAAAVDVVCVQNVVKC